MFVREWKYGKGCFETGKERAAKKRRPNYAVNEEVENAWLVLSTAVLEMCPEVDFECETPFVFCSASVRTVFGKRLRTLLTSR